MSDDHMSRKRSNLSLKHVGETMSDHYKAAGWVKCPESGLTYHPVYDAGCGHCKSCDDKEMRCYECGRLLVSEVTRDAGKCRLCW